MPPHIYWKIPGRVLVSESEGMLSSAMMTEYNRIAADMIAVEGIAPVHTIADVSRKTGLSPDFYNIKNIREMFSPGALNGNPGWIVSVDPAPQRVVLSMANMTAQLTKRHFHICTSMAEALSFLYEQDQTLAVIKLETMQLRAIIP